MHRHYLDVDLGEAGAGQLHYRRAEPPAGATRRTPVVCLHQTPTSSLEFEPLMRELAHERLVVAPDTPGYGGSDGPPAPQSIDWYAAILARALESLGFGAGPLGRPVLFGYHTGAVLAAQVALARPALVAGIVLHGFPLRTPAERRQRLEALPRGLDVEGWWKKVEWYYDMHVRQAPARATLQERTRVFGQDMVAGPDFWFTYHGVWSWPYEERLPRIAVPCLAIAADEVLAEATRASARLVPGCELRELPQVKGASALATQAAEVAACVRDFADRLS
ncbi:MAG: alpha/beta hydrolase [Steroidobacteraceae bacterium]|jgi:pimeloyl-ACP methyl ester carboxylesterase|nr:alpha/beta hydrolase [Steroidobacteraceae bacterium]